MTVDDVKERLKYFTEHTGWWDDEEAHGTEDEIHLDVLKAIAGGTAENPQEMAKLAISTDEYEFARWCA